MKKRKKIRAENARKKRARREEKRKAKGTMTMTEKKIVSTADIRRAMEKKEYAAVINSFADMLAQGNPSEECFGDVARAYFELGDYTRAASWVTTTLSRDPSNVDARILLARICQREKRPDDALKLYENILASHGAAVSEEQGAEIKRLAGLDARLNPEKTRTEYPHLAAFLGMGGKPAAVIPAATAAPVPPVAPSVVVEKSPTPSAASTVAVHATQQVREILAQTIRPVEKVEALNAFAGAAYIADDYAGAKTFLMAALEVDPGCDDTIRNMALLLHEMGEKDKALQIAAKMRRADFMLLRALKS